MIPSIAFGSRIHYLTAIAVDSHLMLAEHDWGLPKMGITNSRSVILLWRQNDRMGRRRECLLCSLANPLFGASKMNPSGNCLFLKASQSLPLPRGLEAMLMRRVSFTGG